MKVTCDNCKAVIDFVPALDEIREEIKELLLDKMEEFTEEEMSAYIEHFYGCVTGAIQDSVDHSGAHLRVMRERAAKKFGRQATEPKQ